MVVSFYTAVFVCLFEKRILVVLPPLILLRTRGIGDGVVTFSDGVSGPRSSATGTTAFFLMELRYYKGETCVNRSNKTLKERKKFLKNI